MVVNVTTDNHLTGSEELVEQVEAAAEASLKRFGTQIMRLKVHLADENSHKQSEFDKRCTIEARLAGLQPVAATDTGASVDQAVDGALDKLVALLEHKLGRLGDRKGRMSQGGEAE